MKARNLIILLLLLGLGQPDIVWSAKKYPDSVLQLVAETKQAIATIDMKTFKDVVDRKNYDMIIDVREPDEYAVGHVPGAVNIPRGVIEFRIWRYVGFPDSTDTSKRIFLYCMSGSRCSLATHSLKKLGFTGVVAVDMKFKNWEKAGYPTDFKVD